MSTQTNNTHEVDALTLDTQADMIMACIKILFVNGQTTQQIMAEALAIAAVLQKKIALEVEWGKLWLCLTDEYGAQAERVVFVQPAAVHMGKVVATMRLLSEFCEGKIRLTDAYRQLLTIEQSPPAKTWLFALAAAAGSVALAIIFGLSDARAACLIFLSGALGAFTRRYVATHSTNLFVQPFLAACIAGLIAAIAVYYHLNASFQLIALCPCMVLVPGPHFLNSALDVIHGRLQLGLSRFILAALVCVSISLGVLAGTAFLSVDLPFNPGSAQHVLLWQDMFGAGVAIIAYNIFFSMPFYLMAWPVCIGVLGHMLRWHALVVSGASAATANFEACLLVSVVLTLVAYRQRLPFAALAFSAVVSMIPGVYVFRMMSGLIALTGALPMSYTYLSQTIYLGLNALTILGAMSLGLMVPKLILDKTVKHRFKHLP